jgi:hypothetical protein
MKKNAIIFVDEKTARVTKAFAKNACIFGTEEFKLWREYLSYYPNAKMETKSIKKTENKKNRRNMTYVNMKEFISTQPNAKELAEEFEVIKKRSKVQSSPYQYVLNWFEGKFEGYNDFEQFKAKKEAERAEDEATSKND